MINLMDRLDKIKHIIEDDSFYNKKSQGGEVNFHIFSYDPSEENVIRDYIKNFQMSYSHTNSKVKPIVFDLFEMILEILESKKIGNSNILEMAINKENNEGSERLIKSIISFLKPEVFSNIIAEKSVGYNLIIITGVGKAYPLIRSHKILYSLPAVQNTIPVILFYPGDYDQKQLRLFNGEKFEGLKDDNYYRAFKLV